MCEHSSDGRRSQAFSRYFLPFVLARHFDAKIDFFLVHKVLLFLKIRGGHIIALIRSKVQRFWWFG
jgi:hypothetical protein